MANKMLIDATHPEETRVVVLRGNRVEEFDFESAQRKQLRGNIYLAKVTRVEPSLQAAFVDYGGNRHGFLAFSEIHPDYYQIPVADRQALIDEESRAHRAADDEADRRGRRYRGHRQRGAERPRDEAVRGEALAAGELAREAAEIPAGEAALGQDQPIAEAAIADSAPRSEVTTASESAFTDAMTDQPLTGEAPQEAIENASEQAIEAERAERDIGELVESAAAETSRADAAGDNGPGAENGHGEEEIVESVGGDAMEEVAERAPRYRPRQYKIQEVIKRRQVMLVQVVKEERGTKGAALTTYLSLAGRYSVLMPNTARGGGISRKITSAEDRNRLKEVAEELEVPEGMGVILRTAGASRTKTEVKRDFEYLLRLWENVRDLTLKSSAPTLVYEEGSLVKRSIRDLYHKDIDEIIVEGEAAYREAKDFMRMLMPSHAKNVKLYKDAQPVFARFGIEAQLDAMFSPTVQLKSGGYIVLNQAEALVAIDVNSGRATREHNIEDTALKTNSEAAAEIARQLRLRDLAGLIVIDFIDMEEHRNNRSVERKLKEALKSDRARIQVGRISHFGLLEMSRQRIRTSVLESSTETCPNCGGTGHVRSVSSVSLQLLRALEEILLKGATHNLIVRTRSNIALYVLNNKRAHLRALEERFRIAIAINADPTMTGLPPFTIDRGEQVMTLEQAQAIAVQPSPVMTVADDEDIEDELAAEPVEDGEPAQQIAAIAQAERPEHGERTEQDATRDGLRRRRRGRRGRGGRVRGSEPREPASFTQEGAPVNAMAQAEDFQVQPEGEGSEMPVTGGGAPMPGREPRDNGPRGDGRRRRRGRRGGRRNRQGREGGEAIPYERDGADDMTAMPASGRTEPNAAPRMEPRMEPRSFEPRIEPRPFEPSAAQPAAAESETPRRRSTVREPAPVFDGSEIVPSSPLAPPPSAAPPPPPPEQSEPDRPRRGGWWSRRG